MKKILAFLLCFLLCIEQSSFAQIAGQLDISGHLAAFRNTLIPDTFRPLHLRYLQYNSLNNSFQLFLDKGGLKNPQPQELESTTKELLKYFFIGVTLPNESFWVNLRPDAEDNIIDDRLAQTDIGKIMLEADLQLKKDTAKATSPETPEGREYWDKLYKKAGEIFGSENITIPTLTRPWIVPDEIIIRETQDSAYIYKATLKVMLEQDYLKDSTAYSFKDERLKELNEYSSQLIRELIIPKLTKEINSSKRYASLRQVYYSLIMAQWFKARHKGLSPKGTVPDLIDSRYLTNLTSKENWSKTTYFKEYQKSFKEGEYNIKEPVYTLYGQSIRSYFSGGMKFDIGIQPFGATNGGSSPVSAVVASSSPITRDNEMALIVPGTPQQGAVGIQVVSSPMQPQEEASLPVSMRQEAELYSIPQSSVTGRALARSINAVLASERANDAEYGTYRQLAYAGRRIFFSPQYSAYLNAHGITVKQAFDEFVVDLEGGTFAWTPERFERFKELLRKIPTVESPNDDLFVDVLVDLTPEQIRFLKTQHVYLQLTEICGNQCVICRMGRRKAAMQQHMPFPVAVKIMRWGAMERVDLTPYYDSEPFEYRDDLIGATLLDITQWAQRLGMQPMDIVTHGTSGQMNARAEEIASEIPYPLYISVHLFHQDVLAFLRSSARSDEKRKSIISSYARRFASLIRGAIRSGRYFSIRKFRSGNVWDAWNKLLNNTPAQGVIREIYTMQDEVWESLKQEIGAQELESRVNPGAEILWIGSAARLLKSLGVDEEIISQIQDRQLGADAFDAALRERKGPEIVMKPNGELVMSVPEGFENRSRLVREVFGSHESERFKTFVRLLRVASKMKFDARKSYILAQDLDEGDREFVFQFTAPHRDTYYGKRSTVQNMYEIELYDNGNFSMFIAFFFSKTGAGDLLANLSEENLRLVYDALQNVPIPLHLPVSVKFKYYDTDTERDIYHSAEFSFEYADEANPHIKRNIFETIRPFALPVRVFQSNLGSSSSSASPAEAKKPRASSPVVPAESAFSAAEKKSVVETATVSTPEGLLTNQLKQYISDHRQNPFEVLITAVRENQVVALGENHDDARMIKFAADVLPLLVRQGLTHFAFEGKIQYQNALEVFIAAWKESGENDFDKFIEKEIWVKIIDAGGWKRLEFSPLLNRLPKPSLNEADILYGRKPIPPSIELLRNIIPSSYDTPESIRERFRFFKAAYDEGIKVKFIDSRTIYGQEGNRDMAEAIASVIADNPSAKILFYGGNEHAQKNEYPANASYNANRFIPAEPISQYLRQLLPDIRVYTVVQNASLGERKSFLSLPGLEELEKESFALVELEETPLRDLPFSYYTESYQWLEVHPSNRLGRVADAVIFHGMNPAVNASSPMVPQDEVRSAIEVDNISTGILEALIRPYEKDNKIYVDGIDRNQTPLTRFVKAMQENGLTYNEIGLLYGALRSLDPQLEQRVGDWYKDVRRSMREGKYDIFFGSPLPVPEDIQQQVLELHRRLQTGSQNSHLQDLAIELIRIKAFGGDGKKLVYKVQEYLRKSGNLDEDINLRMVFNDVVEKVGQLMGLSDEQIKSIQQSVLLIKSYNRKLSAEEETFLNLIRILSHINEKGTVESRRDVMLIMKYQKEGIIKSEFKDSFDSSDFSLNSDLTYNLPEGGKEILWRELKRLALPDILKLALIIAQELFSYSTARFRGDRFAENKNIILINSTDTEREFKRSVAAEAGHAILEALSGYKTEELDLAVHEAFDALLEEIIIPGSSEELRTPLRVAIAKVIKRAIKDGEFTKNGLLKEERDPGLDYYFGLREGMKKSDHDEIGNIVIELMKNPIALRRILAKLGLSEEEAYIVSHYDPALVSHAIGIFLTTNFIRSFGTLVTVRVFKKITTEQPKVLSDFRLFEEAFYNLQPQVSREFAIVPINQQGGGVYGSTSSPMVPQDETGKYEYGGIDFRSLPIVTQAIGNLSANISSSPIHNLVSVNLDEEWLQIERMASSGITPSSERIKEYIQTSCAQDNITQDKDKILLCISDILRLQEESCAPTDDMLRDILVVLESMNSAQEFKEVFLGASPA